MPEEKAVYSIDFDSQPRPDDPLIIKCDIKYASKWLDKGYLLIAASTEYAVLCLPHIYGPMAVVTIQEDLALGAQDVALIASYQTLKERDARIRERLDPLFSELRNANTDILAHAAMIEIQFWRDVAKIKTKPVDLNGWIDDHHSR